MLGYILSKKLNILDYYQLLMYKIIKKEIQEAIFAANSFKNTGIDSIPAMLWPKTWPIIKIIVTALFWSSIAQKKPFKRWKIAKIISFKKPQKGNYINLGLFKPIAFLPTFSKAFKLVITQRLSFLVKNYGLFLNNYYSRQKKNIYYRCFDHSTRKIFSDMEK